MLAGLFKAPTKYSPNVNLPAARARANDVLSNLVDAGFMTEGQVYAARRNPATPVDHTERGSPDWYLDFAYRRGQGARRGGQARRRSRADRANRSRPRACRPRPRRVIEDDAARQGAGLSRASGGDRGRGDRRPRARDGRRPRLWREPVQSRDRRAAPARLLVQDLRLSDRAADRQVPRRHADRRLEHLHRRLLRAQLSTGESGGIDAAATRRWRNRSTPRRSACRSRSARSIGRRSRAITSARSPRSAARKIVETARAMGVTTPLVGHGLAAGRRGRGQDDRHGRRQRDPRQRRQTRDALCGDRNPQFERRRDLLPRRQRAAAGSGRSRPTRSPR